MSVEFLKLAIELATRNVESGGGPFGAVVVREGRVVATGVNRVTTANDPTAHAEVVAIRSACAALGTFSLDGCDVYSSCEPCPMCLGALYWARPRAIYYAGTRDDAAAAGFDDRLIYDEIPLPPERRSLRTVRVAVEGESEPFARWMARPERAEY